MLNRFQKEALNLILLDEYAQRYPLSAYILTVFAFVVLAVSLIF